MGKFSSWLFGLGLGAGLMYFLDPQMGDRRKAMVRDQAMRLQSKADEGLETATRDLRNRARGLLSDGLAVVSDEGVADNILAERVRSRMGFLARHPGAVEVNVDQGRVVLDGDMLASEAEAFVQGVRRIRGVRDVQNNLRVHEEAGDIPQLQGEGWMQGQNMQWSPSSRLLATIGAGYLFVYGMGRGGLIGLLSRLGGIVLGTRALTNRNVKSLTGQGTGEEAVHVQKSININAPMDEVYGLLSNFENFPRFMNNIEEIRTMGGDRSHWVVKGPAGSKVEFDAVMTKNIPNQLVAWETTPDSQVSHRGQVRFKENKQGRTQVNVNMDYTPPAGIAGHAVAKLFGKDPKSEMDADLARMITLLEEGKTTSGKQRVRRDEVMPVTGGSGSDQGGEAGQGDFDSMREDSTDYQGGVGVNREEDISLTDDDMGGDMGRSGGRRRDNDEMGGMGGGPLTPSDL